MGQKYKILNTGEVQWPRCCARCRSDDALTAANASGGHIAGFNGVTMTGELLELNYPVCAEHAKGLSFANLLTRKTLGVSVLRWMAFILGPLSLLLGPVLLIGGLLSLFGHSSNGPGTSISMLIITLLPGVLLVLIWRAYRQLPIRITKVEADSFTLQFNDSLYAGQFKRLNKALLLK
ncbi:hypothetical protein [Chitinibacter tainanensis]|uniref:hypothetical protein n=1 Tax=Chitinibacter tainanensis TaxID=230667 RepID=UPI0023540D24|nr:hypothetical protein [Chitinibacter tainanensis]